MRNASKRPVLLASPETIAAEIHRLSGLPLAGLKKAWAAEFGRAPHKGLWRDFLLRSLAWRLQEKAFGGHDKATLRLLEALGRKTGPDPLYQRLKTGTVLVREFAGVQHSVTLVPEGFVWRDRTYSSLSAIAKLITGTNWNGLRFFGLREGKAKKGPEPLEARA